MPRPDRSPESAEALFAAIRAVHRKYPDLRVGQIIAAAAYNARETFDPFNFENEHLTAAIYEYLANVQVPKI
jgi:hypothetical protein